LELQSGKIPKDQSKFASIVPDALKKQLAAGKVNLDDPVTTIALLKLNAVVGALFICRES
jgi:hypothetical protein